MRKFFIIILVSTMASTFYAQQLKIEGRIIMLKKLQLKKHEIQSFKKVKQQMKMEILNFNI